jgi:hypothetical protein
MIHRTLAMTSDESKLVVLQALALEAHGQIKSGAIDHSFAHDTLIDVADSLGLIAHYRHDTIEHVIRMGLIGQTALTNGSATKAVGNNAAHDTGSSELQLDVRRMSDVESKSIEWLWPNRIAIGKQTLIGGEPGVGKSQLSAALAAAVTTGGEWPCREGRAPLGNVVILSAEDDAADTIKPRLDAAGADVTRVYQVSAVQQRDGKGRRVFNLQIDLPLLEQEIASIGNVRLVIIDPISSYMGKADSHKNTDVRATLEPVGDMAARLGVAVVSITHFAKSTGKSAINSFIGSVGFIAVSRAGYTVTYDPESEDPARRLFLRGKNNLSPERRGHAFRIEQRLLEGDILSSAVVWNHEWINKTADDVLGACVDDKSGNPGRAEAENFLRDLLADGPLPATDIEAEAKQAGISRKMMRRAQHELGVRVERKAVSGSGLGKSGRWYWTLPRDPDAPKMSDFP